MKAKLTRFDAAEHLRSAEEMSAYLLACMEEAGDDAAFVAKALGDIARAKGMSQIAKASGLSRESLYKALSGERVPAFDTVLKVCHALGIQFTPSPIPQSGH
jgi:probable addiction module antidote protein